MAETINMPKLGFDMAEGTLVRWVKQVGENINKGEVLAEIETDKATVEVESSASGVVRRLLVDEGAVVPVNSAIAIVGTADEEINDQPPVSREQGSVSSTPSTAGGQVKVAETPQKALAPAPVPEGVPAMPAGPIKASP